MIIVIFDPTKAQSNLTKHDISFDEAQVALLDPYALVQEDYDHEEVRFVLLGMANQLLVVVYCYTDEENIVRIISARKATKKEQKTYASGI